MKLTPNQRMAVFLQNAQQDNDTEEIIPLSVWLERLYATHIGDKKLSVQEECIVWQKIIAESSAAQTLFKTAGAARLARDAWILSAQWKIPAWEGPVTEDVAVYREWAFAYQAFCTRHGWTDSATFIDALIDLIIIKQLSLPPDITLIGFEELTPQLSYFFDRVKEAGTHITASSVTGFKSNAKRLSVSDTEEELRSAAWMAKHWLGLKPGCLIGIVILDLEQRREQAVRIFEEILPRNTFNVAAPITINDYPMIEAALLVLSLLIQENPLEKWSQLLRSPFFAGALSEQLERSMLDVQVRQQGELEYSVNRFLKQCKKIVKKASRLQCEMWLKSLQRLVAEQSSLKMKRTAIEWQHKCTALLDMVGWPGERGLTVEEQEVQQRWRELLADYAQMGRILPEHDYCSAIAYITRLAQDTTFLPAAVPPSSTRPVQVLGLLETIGIPFDYLWVTGMHRENWPLEPAPNPFIPLFVQRAFDMPRSSPTRELKMAKKFTEQLCQGAPEVIFSYPAVVDDNPTTISALLAHLPEITKASLGIPKAWEPSFLSKPILSSVQQKVIESTINFIPSEKNRGNLKALKLQALCPFRAFAEIRLQAQPLPAMTRLGLTPAERGEIIHATLHLFWQGLENQAQLQALSQEALSERINTVIEQVLQVWQIKRPNTLTPRYSALEKKRTFQLIYAFLQLEKTRPYFEVVAREAEKIVDIQGLSFTIRIDRIDRLSNGDEIMIDYKTGVVSLQDWFGESLKDPQLPLYCVTGDLRPKGIAYGIIRPDGVQFKGIAKDETVLPGLKSIKKAQALGACDTWEDQCETWQTQITTLAQDFQAGVVNVDPAEGEKTCRTCFLRSLCRITATPYFGFLTWQHK